LLLVEDNLAEARLLKEFLKGTLFNQVTLTHTKRLSEAIDQLKRAPFHLILLDLTLPDSYGLASLDTLLKAAPHLPIVVLTNTNDDELAVEAVRHGAQDYLVKRQMDQEILVRSVRYAIERKQTAEALREANEILELRVQERTIALKQANDLLQQEVIWRQQIQERLELAQQAGKIGTFEWNVRSNQVTWSAELEALYGLAPGSFHNCYEAWIQTLHPDDRARIEQEFWQAIEACQGIDTEFRIFWKNGESRWIAVKSSLFHDQTTGKAMRMIGIHMDITEKKQLEAQFLRAQRLESLGTLASGIAHDLNNILTPILVGVQLLPLKFPNLNDHTRQLLKTIEGSAQRGADLVKQILSFARGVEGNRVYLQIQHLLTEIRRIIEQTLPKSIDIETNIPLDLWTIHGDATQLHQVFMNLCVNARDAMPQGGSLSVEAENTTVDDQYARMHLDAAVGSYVVITVTDTGMGIPAQIIHRIFDPFFTTKEFGKGTGLGLSAVLGIVRSHGGFVDVISHENQGSQFKVYLPAHESSVIQNKQDEVLLLGQQELILIVDDEAMIRDTVRSTLETYQYQVLTASDGLEAIALMAEHKNKIRGVLLDLMMPVMDGVATIPLLRQFSPNVYVVAMSGVNVTETVAQSEHLGCQDFLSKPFTTKELLQVLHQGLTAARPVDSPTAILSTLKSF
jgi:PAS domain S-box-containing protein